MKQKLSSILATDAFELEERNPQLAEKMRVMAQEQLCWEQYDEDQAAIRLVRSLDRRLLG